MHCFKSKEAKDQEGHGKETKQNDYMVLDQGLCIGLMRMGWLDGGMKPKAIGVCHAAMQLPHNDLGYNPNAITLGGK